METATLTGTSQVHSPLGVRLTCGLIAPFVTPVAQAELTDRWGLTPEQFFSASLATVDRLAAYPTVHGALGAWVRSHPLPDAVRERLGALLRDLPGDPTRAQRQLDDWAAQHTNRMIEQFPVTLNEDTKMVLASALAAEDVWLRSATQSQIRFTGAPTMAFTLDAAEYDARSTPDGSAIRVTLPLASALEMDFCLSIDGPLAAARLLADGTIFTEPVTVAHPFVTARPVPAPTPNLEVTVPEFTTRTLLDLTQDAEQWGLTAALAPAGLPGLGHLEVDEAKQSAFIEVTRTGVRAVAVTAFSALRAAGAAPTTNTFEKRVIRFDEPFAYALRAPGMPEALFAGTYTR